MRSDEPADDHGAASASPLDALDPQPDEPVVDQDVVPRLQHLADHGRADRELAVSGSLLGGDDDLVARLQRDGRRQLADPELRALEVGDHRERAADLPGLRAREPARAACSSWVPCEKFRRAASIPASARASTVSADEETGPSVATIFVRRGVSADMVSA